MFGLFIALNGIVSLVYSQSSTAMMGSSTSPTTVATWEDLYVIPIEVVSELSRVCIVMSRRDYSLLTSRPYTYIQYPSSYRATLTQATDIVDSSFRTAEMSSSRVQMTMNQVSQQLNTALDLWSQATIQEMQAFLPTTLNSIARMANGATDAFAEVSKGIDKAVTFFDELLQAVQPSSSPSSTTSSSAISTSTQANKSSLDIDHAVALSNILGQLKSLAAVWNRMAQVATKLALLTRQATQVIHI